MPPKRSRCKNFTDDESLQLISIVSSHRSVIENKQITAVVNAEKAAAWLQMELEYNQYFPRAPRTADQLLSKYENLKNKGRRYAASLRQATCATGGGVSNINKDIVLDAVLELINKKTVEGETNDSDDDACPQEMNIREVVAVHEPLPISMDVDPVIQLVESSQSSPQQQHINIFSPPVAGKAKKCLKFSRRRRVSGTNHTNVLQKKASMYAAKEKLILLECKEKEIKIKMLEVELEEKSELKNIRVAMAKEELEGKILENKIKSATLMK